MSNRIVNASNYLIFRYPTEYIVILFPVIVGVLVNTFFNLSHDLSASTSVVLRDIPLASIDTYLISTKVTITIILAFFICYRWSNMQNDGSYGFWLTLGVNRRSFYLRAIWKYVALIYSGQLFGLALVFYMNQFLLEFDIMLKLLLLMAVNVVFIVSFAVLLGNILKNPEFSSLIYLIAMGLNLGFNQEEGTFLALLFQSDLQYSSESAWLSFFASLPVVIFIIIYSLRKHLGYDIEI